MVVQGAVRDVRVIPWLWCVARHGEQVGDVNEIEGETGIRGVEAAIAVGFEVIAIDLGRERLGRDGPDAVRVFFHGNGPLDTIEGE